MNEIRYNSVPKPNNSAFWLVALTLLVLLFATGRDSFSLYHRLSAVRTENQRAAVVLRASGEKVAFIESVHADLQKLAPTDPAAAQLMTELFPQNSTTTVEPSDKPASTP